MRMREREEQRETEHRARQRVGGREGERERKGERFSHPYQGFPARFPLLKNLHHLLISPSWGPRLQ
jgi:hypothetical protein